MTRKEFTLWVVVFVLAFTTVIADGREPKHIEQPQHQEELQLTYEMVVSTSTVTWLSPTLLKNDSFGTF